MMTRILRHFTANEEQLESFPFKRELSMEAYLVENYGVLGLDNDVFSGEEVDIVQEELTLKQGRSSKDTDGRIDILLTYSSEYIGVVELKLGQLEEIHLKQIEDYLQQKEQILQEFPDILSSDSVSEPKWIGVLVGDSINSKLAEKISNGYVTSSGVPIAALTIQRFRSSRGNVYVTTDTYFKISQYSKDMSKYKFNGKMLGKGRLVLEVIKQHVENNPNITFSELERQFPRKIQGSRGVFSSEEEAIEIRNRDRRRHFIKADELITLSDSTIAVCSQWGIKNIGKFISVAQKYGHKIELYHE